jgi:hypothetical protein
MKKLKTIISRLNIFDYLLIFLLLSAVSFYFLFFKRGVHEIYIDVFSPSPEWTEELYPVNRWQTAALKKGYAQYNSFGETVAEVVDVYSTPWNGGKQEYAFATIKLKASYAKNTKVYSFNGNPLLIGNTFILSANSAAVEGKIINIYKSPEEKSAKLVRKKATITVRYKLQDPLVAEALLRKTELYNTDQKLMFKIIDTKIMPAVMAYPDWRGQLMRTTHPDKKDIYVTLEIPEVECSPYTCFYNHYFPLTVGLGFIMDFGDLLLAEVSTKDSIILNVEYHE